jgi:hypothetical protein
MWNLGGPKKCEESGWKATKVEEVFHLDRGGRGFSVESEVEEVF